MAETLIKFEEIYKIYPMGDTEVRALDGVSFEVEKGEYLAIVGQSGSGKSTCMNIIGCLDVPTKGNYTLSGEHVSELKDDKLADIRNKMIGFIFQQYNLLPKLTVKENVEVSMQYAGISRSERTKRSNAVLERVGLLEKAKNLPNQLSGGQQQRVSIARALAGRPSIILADEPTGALDSKTGASVMALLRKLHDEGQTIILITHDNGIAEEADRLIRLEDGKIVFDSKHDTSGKIGTVQKDAENDVFFNKNISNEGEGGAHENN